MNAMVLETPNNCVIVTDEEMTYLDGGLSADIKWWGVQITFTGNDAEGLGWALATGCGAAWLAAELGAPTVVGGLAFGAIAAGLAIAAGAVGGINWFNEGNGFKYNHFWNGFSTITL